MPKFDDAQVIPDVRYDQWAVNLGLDGTRVERPDEIDAVWDRALAADRPVVIDAVVDPAEIMLPPHFTLEQARNTVGAVLRGDSDWRGIIRRGIPSAITTLRPRGS